MLVKERSCSTVMSNPILYGRADPSAALPGTIVHMNCMWGAQGSNLMDDACVRNFFVPAIVHCPHWRKEPDGSQRRLSGSGRMFGKRRRIFLRLSSLVMKVTF